MWLWFACSCSEDSGGPTGTDPTWDTAHATLPTTALHPAVSATALSCDEPSTHETAPSVNTEIGEGWTFEPDWRNANWDLRWGARGVVVADFDGDGHVDVLVPQFSEPARYLVGDGTGALVESTGKLPAMTPMTGLVGGSAADIDGDGDLDVMMYGQLSPPVVLVNDGNGSFEGTSHLEWDGDFPGCGGSAAWADFDIDGDLDLFYGRLGGAREDDVLVCGSRLLVNDGTGEFTDESDTHLDPLAQEVHALAAGWVQFDDDIWPELYIVADAIFESSSVPIEGHTDKLVDNSAEGMFLDPANQQGLDIKLAGMGLAAGDLNEDGRTDVAVAGWGEVKVLRSTTSVWVDQSGAWGIIPRTDVHQLVAWGGEFVDMDANGELDLAMGFGAAEGDEKQQPDALWMQKAGVWKDEAPAWAFDDMTATRGFVVADLNEDGWPDIVKRELGGVITTHVSNCGANGVLSVLLDDATSNNRLAVGALIKTTVGDTLRSRRVTAGSTSMASGGPPDVFFGFGDSDWVDDVTVVWPDGEVVSYGGLGTRQRIVIRRD